LPFSSLALWFLGLYLDSGIVHNTTQHIHISFLSRSSKITIIIIIIIIIIMTSYIITNTNTNTNTNTDGDTNTTMNTKYIDAGINKSIASRTYEYTVTAMSMATWDTQSAMQVFDAPTSSWGKSNSNLTTATANVTTVATAASKASKTSHAKPSQTTTTTSSQRRLRYPPGLGLGPPPPRSHARSNIKFQLQLQPQPQARSRVTTLRQPRLRHQHNYKPQRFIPPRLRINTFDQTSTVWNPSLIPAKLSNTHSHPLAWGSGHTYTSPTDSSGSGSGSGSDGSEIERWILSPGVPIEASLPGVKRTTSSVKKANLDLDLDLDVELDLSATDEWKTKLEQPLRYLHAAQPTQPIHRAQLIQDSAHSHPQLDYETPGERSTRLTRLALEAQRQLAAEQAEQEKTRQRTKFNALVALNTPIEMPIACPRPRHWSNAVLPVIPEFVRVGREAANANSESAPAMGRQHQAHHQVKSKPHKTALERLLAPTPAPLPPHQLAGFAAPPPELRFFQHEQHDLASIWAAAEAGCFGYSVVAVVGSSSDRPGSNIDLDAAHIAARVVLGDAESCVSEFMAGLLQQSDPVCMAERIEMAWELLGSGTSSFAHADAEQQEVLMLEVEDQLCSWQKLYRGLMETFKDGGVSEGMCNRTGMSQEQILNEMRRRLTLLADLDRLLEEKAAMPA
jgi:hypothetical protein